MGSSSSAEDRSLTVTPVPLAPAASRALGLSEFDRASVTAFVTGEAGEIEKLVEDTRQLAEVLAGPGGDAARVRLLARTAAACRTQLRVLEALLGQRVAARDFEAVAVLNRTLDGVAKRMLAVVKQLGVETSLRQRPSVVIRRAEQVAIAAGLR